MAVFRDIEDARAYFQGDRFAMENGMVLEEIGEGRSVCSMVIRDTHRNANDSVMGGAIFTLADLAFAAAANNTHRPTVAQQASVSFLSGSRGSRLTARAVCKRDGKTSCVYNIDVTDNLGQDVAQIVVTGFKL